MSLPPFVRYIVIGPGARWWKQWAAPFVSSRGWQLIEPQNFDYESSYGRDAALPVSGRMRDGFKYLQVKVEAVLEFRGVPPHDSVLNPGTEDTVIDDLLRYMTLYSGVYCQPLWTEARPQHGVWSGQFKINYRQRTTNPRWVADRSQAIDHLQAALLNVPSTIGQQLPLALQWFLSAQRECEVGTPLVESALYWVCLESQANLHYPKLNDYKKVAALLQSQRFGHIPRLGHFYGLRNNAFHQGQLKNLSEAEAQATRKAGRSLVRAQILNLLGMDHKDFNQEFVDDYTK